MYLWRAVVVRAVVYIAHIQAEMLRMFLSDSGVSQQWPESFVPTVLCHARFALDRYSQCTALFIADQAAFGAVFCPIRGISGRFYPPKTRLGRRVRTLPIPAHSACFVTLATRNGHDLFHDPRLVPSLKPIMDSAFGAEFFRQLIPLATRILIRKMIALIIFRHFATGRPVCLLGQNSARIGSIRSPKCVGKFQITPKSSFFFVRRFFILGPT